MVPAAGKRGPFRKTSAVQGSMSMWQEQRLAQSSGLDRVAEGGWGSSVIAHGAQCGEGVLSLTVVLHAALSWRRNKTVTKTDEC